MNKFDVPYNHEELREITLRWLESHEFGHITKGMMEKHLRRYKKIIDLVIRRLRIGILMKKLILLKV